MNNKRKLLDKLSNKSNDDIIRELKASFVAEDKAEPFYSREYVEETIRVFDMLDGQNPQPEVDYKDEAVKDIIADIFRYFRGDEQ